MRSATAVSGFRNLVLRFVPGGFCGLADVISGLPVGLAKTFRWHHFTPTVAGGGSVRRRGPVLVALFY